jgi:tetratricopeptide (TPR) repeat protein
MQAFPCLGRRSRSAGPRARRSFIAGAVAAAVATAAAVTLAPLAAAAAPPPPAGPAAPASASASEPPAAELARAIDRAEAALRDGETQIAESRFRTALLEGWLVRGALDVADGRLEDAAAAFRRAASSAVETRRPKVSLAAVHLRRGEAAEAVEELRGLVSAHPADGTVRRLLAQALIAAGQPEEAIQELEELYAAAGDPETAFSLATGHLRHGRLERAETLLEEIARGRPAPETWVLIGRTYRDSQRWERARAALETALGIDPRARRAHFYLGTIELLAHGVSRYTEAAERFAAELRIAPDDPVAHFYLGLVLSKQRRFEEAERHLEIAAGWEPIRLDALRYLGHSLLGLERLDDAVATLEKALALAEDAGGAARARQVEGIHYQLGTALRRLGREDEAAGHLAAAEDRLTEVVADEREELALLITGQPVLDEAEPLAPPLAVPSLEALAPARRDELRGAVEAALSRAYFNLGVLHLRARRFGRAITPLEAAEALRPDFPGLQRSLGAARFNEQRFAAAAEALERARAAEPDDLELRRMLALAWLSGGEPARAAELLEDDPGRPGDRALEFAYGLALVRSGRAAEAEAAFGRLLAEHADWAELHVVLGQAHAQQGDFEAAVAALRRALELAPGAPEASSTLGDIYLRQGRLEEAERAFRAELEHRPGDYGARHRLAVVLDLDGRPEEAVRELEAVLRARPEHADARYLLGKIRLAQGDPEEASTQLEAAAALAPEDANIRYQLAQAYGRSGRQELAEEQLALYRDLKRQEEGRP